MNSTDQGNAFSDELDKLIERFRQEFDLDFGQVIAALQMKSWLLMQEAAKRRDEL